MSDGTLGDVRVFFNAGSRQPGSVPAHGVDFEAAQMAASFSSDDLKYLSNVALADFDFDGLVDIVFLTNPSPLSWGVAVAFQRSDRRGWDRVDYFPDLNASPPHPATSPICTDQRPQTTRRERSGARNRNLIAADIDGTHTRRYRGRVRFAVCSGFETVSAISPGRRGPTPGLLPVAGRSVQRDRPTRHLAHRFRCRTDVRGARGHRH